MKRFFFSTLIIFLLISDTIGQKTDKKHYQASKSVSVPLVDGVLNDAAWLQGEWVDDFTQYLPYNGRKTAQKTEFKLLFDENNLYVAIKALDSSPDSIVKRLTRRDEADGDKVAIIIDSFHDLRTGFLFGVSASGVKYDRMITNNGKNEDSSWDPNWWVKTTINNEGWTAEMKIPFSQLRFEKNSGDVWGLQMIRLFYRKNETDYWQHVPIDASGLIHLIGEMSGVKQIKPRKILDVTPYIVAKTERYPAESGNPFATGKGSQINGGIDAKIGVTNNLTLDLTINPDFGQVEADTSVVNLTTYETFFKEKRPLFIEGKNITSFELGIGGAEEGNDNLFYSRRIGSVPPSEISLKTGEYSDIPLFTSIIGAAKLTGKTKNGLSLGFLNAVTAQENAEIDSAGKRSFQAVEPLTNFFVGRIQKDIDSGNLIIGGMLTAVNRNLEDIPLVDDPGSSLMNNMPGSAYSGGLDFTKYFKGKTYMLNFNSAFSLIKGSELAMVNLQRASTRYFQRPGNRNSVDSSRTSLSGMGGRMQFMKTGNGHWDYLAALTWKSAGFEINDIGYLREADQILELLSASYKVWEPKSFYRNYTLSGAQYTFWDFAGNHIVDGVGVNDIMNFKNYWNTNIYVELDYNQVSKMFLRGGPNMRLPLQILSWYRLSTDPRKKLLVELKLNSNIYQHQSNSLNILTIFTYRPTHRLVLSLSPSYYISNDELQYVDQTIFDNQNKYIFATISQKTLSMSMRINFNITPNFTLQYWGQPFIATGKYSDYKYITNPSASKYYDRFVTYDPKQLSLDAGVYSIDEQMNGIANYRFANPDFNIQKFLSNFVIRWEYNPGSSLYLVWSQNRDSYNLIGDSDFNNNIHDLINTRPYNVFQIKFSYRFGIR